MIEIIPPKILAHGKPVGNRGYETRAARAAAIRGLAARHGCNFFVEYKDVQATYALSYGFAEWVPAGRVCVQ